LIGERIAGGEAPIEIDSPRLPKPPIPGRKNLKCEAAEV